MIIGVVGKPNCGKSTFFKAATLAEVEIANRPFVTIKANRGFGFVKTPCSDKELNLQCKPKFGYCLNHQRFIPVELLDVAGLVPGAHKGLGLGNQFLDDLRQADAFIHIIDVSGGTNEKGEPVASGDYNPAEDIRFLEIELDMWLFQIIKKGWEKFARTIKQEKLGIKEELVKHLSGLKISEGVVTDALKSMDKDPIKWDDSTLLHLAETLRKKSKPMIIAANKVDVAGGKERLLILQKEFPDYAIIPCSAETELALREAAKSGLINYIPGSSTFEIIKQDELKTKQKTAIQFIENFLKQYASTGVQDILDAVAFNLLNQIVVFPVENENKLIDSKGNVLPDAHLLVNGATALDLAYKIHTSIGEKFNSAIDARTKKRVGRNYQLKNSDIIRIVVS